METWKPITLKVNSAGDYGRGDHCIEFTANVEFTPGEPIVMYYRDGSGYPGSPDELEILSVRATSYDGFKRKEDDWWKWLDNWLRRRLWDSKEFEEECFEELDRYLSWEGDW